jgi:hypothetical protein
MNGPNKLKGYITPGWLELARGETLLGLRANFRLLILPTNIKLGWK